MLDTRPLLKFILLFFLIYGILITAYPLLHYQTGAYVNSLGNKFLNSPVKNSVVTFVKANEKSNIEIRVGNMTQLVNSKLQIFREGLDSYKFAYVPGALLLALIFASPVSLKRKTLALLLAVFLFNGLLLLRMYIKILHISSQYDSLQLITPAPFAQKLIDLLNAFLVDYTHITLIIVAFIWFTVTFRKEDLSLILSKTEN